LQCFVARGGCSGVNACACRHRLKGGRVGVASGYDVRDFGVSTDILWGIAIRHVTGDPAVRPQRSCRTHVPRQFIDSFLIDTLAYEPANARRQAVAASRRSARRS
jgi:hypothetical protein